MWPERPKIGASGLLARQILIIFHIMEPMDIRRLTASKLELCPARDFFAGITKWCTAFSIMRPSTMSFQYGNQGSIIVTPYGEPLELADTVADPERFRKALSNAVFEYVDRCNRAIAMLPYRPAQRYNMYRTAGEPSRPGQVYRVVLWTAVGEWGEYKFYFLPEWEANRKTMSANDAPKEAYMFPEWVSNGKAVDGRG